MRVLVTGGAGFIGSHLVDAYVADGHDVLVIDDLSAGSRENVHDAARFEAVDVRNRSRVLNVVDSFRPEIVNHHAAQIEVCRSLDDPVADAQVNLLGTLHLLEAAAKTGSKVFLFASSGGATAGETAMPAEEAEGKRPSSPYGAAKLAAETYVFVYGRTLGLRTATLRYANVYGPRQGLRGEAGVVSIMIRRMIEDQEVAIFGDGRQTRDFVFVGDAVRANLDVARWLLERRHAPESVDDHAFHIGSGQATSINALFGKLARRTGYAKPPEHAPARAGEIVHSVLCCRKAELAFGFVARTALDEGLKKTVEWFRSAVS